MDTDDDTVGGIHRAARAAAATGTANIDGRIPCHSDDLLLSDLRQTLGRAWFRATTALTSSPTCIPMLWTISDPELAAGDEEGPLRCPQLARQSMIQPDGYPDDSTDQSSSAAQQPISGRR